MTNEKIKELAREYIDSCTERAGVKYETGWKDLFSRRCR